DLPDARLVLVDAGRPHAHLIGRALRQRTDARCALWSLRPGGDEAREIESRLTLSARSAHDDHSPGLLTEDLRARRPDRPDDHDECDGDWHPRHGRHREQGPFRHAPRTIRDVVRWRDGSVTRAEYHVQGCTRATRPRARSSRVASRWRGSAG